MAGKALSREQVLRAAIELVTEAGIESLSMRKLGRALGVEAMSLYNHVAGKDQMLDGMVDLVWSQIELPAAGGDWRAAIRTTATSAHDILMRHPWVCRLVMSPDRDHPARLRYIEAILARLRQAGFSAELTYHAYHAVDSHIIGFTVWEIGHAMPAQQLADMAETILPMLAGQHPHLAEHARQHLAGLDGEGVDEFAFALDLILDGLERLRAPTARSRRSKAR